MKLFFTVSICIAFCIAVFFSSSTQSNSTVPPAGKTMAPGEGSCANTGCHTNSSSGSGSVAFNFNNSSSAYLPGQTYPIAITVSDPIATRFGFEVTAIDDNGQKAGTFVITNPANTAKPTNGAVSGREYVSHRSASTTNTWSFEWVAPDVSVGNVTFYYTGNGANGNGNAAGDKIYSGQSSISVLTSTAMHELPGILIANPVVQQIEIRSTLFAGKSFNVAMHDLLGKKVMEANVFNPFERAFIPLNDNIRNGVYVVTVEAQGINQRSKVIVQQ